MEPVVKLPYPRAPFDRDVNYTCTVCSGLTRFRGLHASDNRSPLIQPWVCPRCTEAGYRAAGHPPDAG